MVNGLYLYSVFLVFQRITFTHIYAVMADGAMEGANCSSERN